MRLRHTQHILRGDRFHAVTIRIKVVRWQSEDLHVRQSTRHFGGGFESNRENTDQITRSQRQFGITDRRFANPRELEGNFAQRIGRDRRFHRRRNFKRAGSTTPIERRVCAVGVGVHFAQIQIKPRRKESAQNRVHHHYGEIILVETRNRHVPHAHLRLRRVRLVHQMHARLEKPLGIHRLRDHWRLAGPIAKVRAGQLHRVLHINVADHHQRRGVGTIELCVIRLHAFARETHDALFVTAGQPCETRFRLIEQTREEHVGQPARFGAQLGQIGQSLATHALQLRLGK